MNKEIVLVKEIKLLKVIINQKLNFQNVTDLIRKTGKVGNGWITTTERTRRG